MNHEEYYTPELNAAQNRRIELDKALSRVLMYDAQQVTTSPINNPGVAEKYSSEPTKVVSTEEHNARKNVAEILRQTDSFPIPKDNNMVE